MCMGVATLGLCFLGVFHYAFMHSLMYNVLLFGWIGWVCVFPIRHIRLVALKPFLRTLNKIWPLHPTGSWLGQPKCEETLSMSTVTSFRDGSPLLWCQANITLFTFITMFCSIDSILWNFLHIHTKYSTKYYQSHKIVLWIWIMIWTIEFPWEILVGFKSM